MPHLTLAGEEIYYTHSDAGHQKSVVLIHGSGGDHTHWPQDLRDFTGAEVYALDLPGHGRSSGCGRRDVDAYAGVLKAFINAMNIRRAVLGGHSLGGAIALSIALERPEWLAGIILVGTGARLRVHPDILDNLLVDYPSTVEHLSRRSLAPGAAQELVDYIRKRFLKTPAEITHADLTACDRFDIMREVNAIACPTLVICGSQDQLTPVKYGRFLHAHIPGAQLVEIPAAGHMMALENSAAVIQAVSAFLKKLGRLKADQNEP